MKRKGIEPNEVRKYFLITGAFLIFMIGSLSFFLSWLQKDVEINSQKNVAINVERQSYHLDSIIDIQFSYLFGIAAYMVDGKTKVILAVPIYKDGGVMGVLGASYNVGALNQMLFDDIYDGVGFSMIIDSSGRIISCDSGKAYRNIGISDNVYEFYVKNGEVSEKDMAEAKSNIQNQKAGILVLKDKNEVSYLAYDTLEMNDWMLCYVVPQSKAQESYQFVQDRQVMLVFVIGGGMIAFLLIILYRESQKQKHEGACKYRWSDTAS